jgi:imidazolonepropionase-like amidohydrolase
MRLRSPAARAPRRRAPSRFSGVFLLAGALFLSAPSRASDEAVIAFTNVSVVPMDRERVLARQTVVVKGGRITAIGDSRKTKVPKGATLVDGRGKYLVPGFADMHVHLFSDEDSPDSLAPHELAVMLANGVTTIRLMVGTPEHLALRGRIASGELLGPALFVASPQLTGDERAAETNGLLVRTPAEARSAIRDSKVIGYDFIKLTTKITPEVYDAVIAEAKEADIRVIGHVDTQVGLHRALAAGQQIEHLDSYMEAVLKDDLPVKTSVSDVGVYRPANWESLDHVDDRKVEEVAKATAKAGIFTCPTLTFFKLSFAVIATDDEVKSRPDYAFFPRKVLESRHRSRARYWANAPSAERRQRYIAVRNRLVKAIHENGGKILAGSDTPELFLLYGFSLHRELKSLVEAGLSPYAALEAGTKNPALFLRTIEETGTVEKGKQADLVLLDASPLESIESTKRIAGVMVRGRWLPRAQLDTMLEKAAAAFREADRSASATAN